MRCATVLFVISVATTAAADNEPVRSDIVELRHGRMPDQWVFLGWTADGKPVTHRGHCYIGDGSGLQHCRITLSVGKVMTSLLGTAYAPFDGTVTTAQASTAITTERRILDKLGALKMTPREPVKLASSANRCTFVVVLAGKRVGNAIALGKDCLFEGGNSAITDWPTVEAHRSPDGKHLFVMTAANEKSMEWTNPADYEVLLSL